MNSNYSLDIISYSVSITLPKTLQYLPALTRRVQTTSNRYLKPFGQGPSCDSNAKRNQKQSQQIVENRPQWYPIRLDAKIHSKISCSQKKKEKNKISPSGIFQFPSFSLQVHNLSNVENTSKHHISSSVCSTAQFGLLNPHLNPFSWLNHHV